MAQLSNQIKKTIEEMTKLSMMLKDYPAKKKEMDGAINILHDWFDKTKRINKKFFVGEWYASDKKLPPRLKNGYSDWVIVQVETKIIVFIARDRYDYRHSNWDWYPTSMGYKIKYWTKIEPWKKDSKGLLL